MVWHRGEPSKLFSADPDGSHRIPSPPDFVPNEIPIGPKVFPNLNQFCISLYQFYVSYIYIYTYIYMYTRSYFTISPSFRAIPTSSSQTCIARRKVRPPGSWARATCPRCDIRPPYSHSNVHNRKQATGWAPQDS